MKQSRIKKLTAENLTKTLYSLPASCTEFIKVLKEILNR